MISGGVNQFNAFHANGYPTIRPDKCPKNDDRGMIIFVINNNIIGPKLIGIGFNTPNDTVSSGIHILLKHISGKKIMGQNLSILILTTTIHANKTHEYPIAC